MSRGRVDQLGARFSIDPDDDAPPIRVPARPAVADPADWESALDDPAVTAGRSSYRSFYVPDVVFARFRAAVHWSARREDADVDVPENMSVAVTREMARLADELERKFNGGHPFRPTPEQVKAARRRSPR